MAESTNYNSQPFFGRCIKTLAAILGEDFGDTVEHERWKEQASMTSLLDERSKC